MKKAALIAGALLRGLYMKRKNGAGYLTCFIAAGVLLITALFSACVSGSGFGASTRKRESVALLPFSGGQSEDGEYIVSELARQRVFREAFNKVTLVTRTTQAFMRFERKFQRDSGLTDADTIFELGKQLNAQYVMAGYITKLGSQNLVLVSILDVESLQMVAGDYRAYRNIEDIDSLIPEMARKLAGSARRDTRRLPGLSVPPFETGNGVSEGDAQVLAQILAINVANGSKYAVLPRTDNLQRVLDERRRQRGGETDQERVRRLGSGVNARYVLAGSVIRTGGLNRFTADILDIKDGSFIDGYSEQYSAFTEGVDVAPKLAASLNGTRSEGTPSGFVFVPPGTFSMGSANGESDEKPAHQVTISKGFYMSDHEVTQREWAEVMGTTIARQWAMAGNGGGPSRGVGRNYPMYCVNWHEALEYCNRRSVKEGLTPAYSGSGEHITCNFKANGYRLPTEAEWEWAARGGGKDSMIYEYSGSGSVDAAAWYNGNSGGATHPVKTKGANSLGLYDMSGNVWEWCWDRYGGYSSGAQTDPAGASSGAARVWRGGSWNYVAENARVANRSGSTPSHRSSLLGFRLVRP
jgi:formylglycine-generating enzyme required for sulfatase activity/TolB-like protein